VRVPVSLADPLLLDAGPVLAFLAEKRPQPPYPRNVERTNERAVVDVEVTTSGQVSWLRSDPGDRSFRALAEQAARGWTFRSLQLNGQPIRLKGQIAFNWIVA
jgi:hypothetical protein